MEELTKCGEDGSVEILTRAEGKEMGLGKKCIMNVTTNLNEESVSEFETDDAYRELLQNLLDGFVQCNGYSFEGLQIHVDDAGTYSFYTKDYLFAQIVQTEDMIRFINYGVVIGSRNQIMGLGNKSKKKKENIAGRHGEGLKHAALRMLLDGYFVEIFACMKTVNNKKVSYHRFNMKMDNDDMMYFDETKRSPDPKIPWVHFRVDIKKINEPIREFILEKYMLPLKCIRDVKSKSDHGDILYDAEETGRLYANNLFVCKTSACFGYSLLNTKVPRDRNHLEHEDLVVNAAKIWDNETDENKHLLYETLCKHRGRVFESDIVLELNRVKTISVIERYVSHKNGDAIIIKGEHETRFKRQFNLLYYIEKSAWEEVLLEPDYLDRMIAVWETLLWEIPPIQNQPIQCLDFKGIEKITVVDGRSTMIKYAYSPEHGICLNLSAFPSIDEMFQFVAFEVLPAIHPEAYKKHFRAEIINTNDKIIIENERRSSFNNNKNEFHNHKRDRPDAPHGYEWIHVDWIMVETKKIKK